MMDDSLPSQSHFVHQAAAANTLRSSGQLNSIKRKAMQSQVSQKASTLLTFSPPRSSGAQHQHPQHQQQHLSGGSRTQLLHAQHQPNANAGGVGRSPQRNSLIRDSQERPIRSSPKDHSQTAGTLAFNIDWGRPKTAAEANPTPRPRRDDGVTSPRPFLKKGSRREPSFLNRRNKDVDPASLLSGPESMNKSLRHKLLMSGEEAQGETQQRSGDGGGARRSSSLQELKQRGRHSNSATATVTATVAEKGFATTTTAAVSRQHPQQGSRVDTLARTTMLGGGTSGAFVRDRDRDKYARFQHYDLLYEEDETAHDDSQEEILLGGREDGYWGLLKDSVELKDSHGDALDTSTVSISYGAAGGGKATGPPAAHWPVPAFRNDAMGETDDFIALERETVNILRQSASVLQQQPPPDRDGEGEGEPAGKSSGEYSTGMWETSAKDTVAMGTITLTGAHIAQVNQRETAAYDWEYNDLYDNNNDHNNDNDRGDVLTGAGSSADAAGRTGGRGRGYIGGFETTPIDDSHSWGAVSRPALAATYHMGTAGSNSKHTEEDYDETAVAGSGGGLVRSRPRVMPEEVGITNHSGSGSGTGRRGQQSGGRRAAAVTSAGRHSTEAGAETNAHQQQQQQVQLQALQRELGERARELEGELAHYKGENAALRQLRRQQEGLVADLGQQRADLARWVAEERARTTQWCEEQRGLAAKERRAVARQGRDAREVREQQPTRRERAEIESLQATVEKLRVDGEAAARKSKLTERRLLQSLRDQTAAAEEQNQLVLALERDKMELLELLASVTAEDNTGAAAALHAGVRNKRLAGELKRRATAHRERIGVDSYVEEVPVEEVPIQSAAATHDHDENEEDDDDRNLYRDDDRSRYRDYDEEYEDAEDRVVDYTSEYRQQTRAAVTAPLATEGDYRYKQQQTSQQQPSQQQGEGLSSDLRVLAQTVRASWGSAGSGAVEDKEEIGRRSGTGAGTGMLSASSIGTGTGNYSRQQPAVISSMDQLYKPANSAPTTSTTTHAAGSTVSNDGDTKLVQYKNGTVKEVYADGSSLVRFTNGDTKRVDPVHGTTVYYYAQAKTTHTTFRDTGLERYEFPNQQVENHYSDGRKEIIFPDATRKIVHASGLQESIFSDGVVVKEHPNGLREIITVDGSVHQDFGDHK